MADANEIQLKITIDGKDAIATLKLTEDEVGKLKSRLDSVTPTAEKNIDRTSRAVGNLGKISRRDLRIFGSQLLYSANISGRLGNQLNNLATGLMTGGFIGAAFAGFAAIINSITTATREWAQAQKEAIAEVVKIETSTGSFNILEEKIPEAIERLNQRLAALRLNQPRAVFGGAMLELGSEELKLVEETISKLEEANKKYQAKKQVIESLKGLLPYQEAETEEIKKQIPLLQSSLDLMRKQVAEFFKFWTAVKRAREEQEQLRKSRFQVSEVEALKPANPLGDLTPEDIIHQNFQLGAMYDTSMALQDALRGVGYELAFIGGEGARTWLMNVMGIKQVNSVLQQLILKFGELFVQFLLMRAATSLFNFLLPGSGMAFGAFAEGGSGVVNKPTMFLAGENGPESYNFTPLDRTNKNFSPPQHIIVEVTGTMEQKGMDMRAVLNQVERELRTRR